MGRFGTSSARNLIQQVNDARAAAGAPAPAPRPRVAPPAPAVPPVMRSQVDAILAKIESFGEDSLTASERALLRRADMAGAVAEDAAPPVVRQVTDGEVFPFSEEKGPDGEYVPVAEDGVAIRMAEVDGDRVWIRADGRITDQDGRVIGDVSDNPQVASIFEGESDLDNSAIDLGDPATGLRPNRAREDKIGLLASRIRQATMDSDVSRLEGVAGLRQLQAAVSKLSPEDLQNLLSRSELSRYVSPQASDAVRAEAAAEAQRRLDTLAQMAERVRRDPSAMATDKINRNRALATPAPARQAEGTAEAVAAANSLLAAREAAIPQGDWGALAAQFNAAPADQRVAILRSLPEQVRPMISRMLETTEVDGPSISPNALSAAIEPVNDVQSLMEELEAARRAGDAEAEAAARQLLQERFADPQELAEYGDGREAVRSFNDQRLAFDTLRRAVIGSDPEVVSALDTARTKMVTRSQPTVAASDSRAIDAGRPDNLPEQALPGALDDARAADAAFEEARALAPISLPPQLRSIEARREIAGLGEDQPLPPALAGDAEGRVEKRPRSERPLDTADVERLEGARALEDAVASAHEALDAARAEAGVGPMSLEDMDKAGLFPEQIAALRAAYADLDKAYGNRTAVATTGSLDRQMATYHNRIAALRERTDAARSELNSAIAGSRKSGALPDAAEQPLSAADMEARFPREFGQVQKLEQMLERLQMPRTGTRKLPPGASPRSDARLIRDQRSSSQTITEAIRNAGSQSNLRTGETLARSSDVTGDDALVDYSPMQGITDILEEARFRSDLKRGRLGGGSSLSRRLGATDFLWRTKRGQVVDPIATFGSADAAADFLLQRDPQWSGRTDSAGYQVERAMVADGIEMMYGNRSGSRPMTLREGDDAVVFEPTAQPQATEAASNTFPTSGVPTAAEVTDLALRRAYDSIEGDKPPFEEWRKTAQVEVPEDAPTPEAQALEASATELGGEAAAEQPAKPTRKGRGKKNAPASEEPAPEAAADGAEAATEEAAATPARGKGSRRRSSAADPDAAARARKLAEEGPADAADGAPPEPPKDGSAPPDGEDGATPDDGAKTPKKGNILSRNKGRLAIGAGLAGGAYLLSGARRAGEQQRLAEQGDASGQDVFERFVGAPAGGVGGGAGARPIDPAARGGDGASEEAEISRLLTRLGRRSLPASYGIPGSYAPLAD